MSSKTLGDLLPDLLADVPAVLVGDAARARLAAPGVAKLPLMSGLLLECRLGERAGAAPVGLALRAAGERDFADVKTVAGAAQAGAAWTTVAAALCAREGDVEGAAAFTELWLEFDLDAPPPDGGALEPPSAFLQVAESIGRPPRLGPEAAVRRGASAVMLQRTLGWFGADFPGSATALAQVLEAMPASTRVSYLGVMLARGQPGCRLTFDRMPLDGGCTAMLRAIDAAADLSGVVEAIGLLGAWTTHAVLHLDLVPGAGGARLGAVFGFEVEPALLEIERCRVALQARGLITPEQRTALAAWPQRRHRVAAGGGWPAALGDATCFARAVNHLKLVVPAAGSAWTMKAYLGAHWGHAFPAPALWR